MTLGQGKTHQRPAKAEHRVGKRALERGALVPAGDDDDLELRLAGAANEPDFGPVLEEPRATGGDLAKRRRRGGAVDEATEIPSATYQGFTSRRAAITRRRVLDFSLVLPHYSAELPHFLTPYTELCPALNELLLWGTEVAQRRRRRRQDLEAAALAPPGAEPLADLPELDPPAPPRGDEAPRTLAAVVLAGAEADGVAAAGRGERMRRFLARAFGESRAEALSYGQLCSQASGRRELVAGSFFELLVLRSNGVIGLEQEGPLADIRISKSSQWGP